MEASKIRERARVKTAEGVLYVTDVERGDLVVKLTGSLRPFGGKPRQETFEYWVDEDVKLCNWDGVPTEGKTKAQIEAESVVASLERYGLKAEIRIEENHGAVWAWVKLPSEHGVISDSYTGGWYTRTEGRKTTGFRGFTQRGLFRGRKRHSAKLTRRQFFAEVGCRISQAQYRMEQERKASA